MLGDISILCEDIHARLAVRKMCVNYIKHIWCVKAFWVLWSSWLMPSMRPHRDARCLLDVFCNKRSIVSVFSLAAIWHSGYTRSIFHLLGPWRIVTWANSRTSIAGPVPLKLERHNVRCSQASQNNPKCSCPLACTSAVLCRDRIGKSLTVVLCLHKICTIKEWKQMIMLSWDNLECAPNNLTQEDRKQIQALFILVTVDTKCFTDVPLWPACLQQCLFYQPSNKVCSQCFYNTDKRPHYSCADFHVLGKQLRGANKGLFDMWNSPLPFHEVCTIKPKAKDYFQNIFLLVSFNKGMPLSCTEQSFSEGGVMTSQTALAP